MKLKKHLFIRLIIMCLFASGIQDTYSFWGTKTRTHTPVTLSSEPAQKGDSYTRDRFVYGLTRVLATITVSWLFYKSLFLSKKITKNKQKSITRLPIVVSAQKGTDNKNLLKRMEDRHAHYTINIGSGIQVAIVCDGHGGTGPVEYFMCNFKELFRTHLKNNPKNIKLALETTFKIIDKEICKKGQWEDHGTTALVYVSYADTYYIAHVGDSRAVLCRETKALKRSQDHKPDEPSEKERILKHGGQIKDNRVDDLGMSRAVGDAAVKTKHPGSIIATPTITDYRNKASNRFIIMASDGLWDVIKSQDAVDRALASLTENPHNYQKAAEELVCFATKQWETKNPGRTDDITVMIIPLN